MFAGRFLTGRSAVVRVVAVTVTVAGLRDRPVLVAAVVRPADPDPAHPDPAHGRTGQREQGEQRREEAGQRAGSGGGGEPLSPNRRPAAR